MKKNTGRTPAERLMSPFQEFIKQEASGGILLLACTAIALAWANSPWYDAYIDLWNVKLTMGAGSFVLSKPLLLWINDGLMAVFFLVVGLEIKREMLMGELATFKQAVIPLAGALGGMLLPAILFLSFNIGKEGASGWGIPMATDIAFALGVLALLGSKAPLALKVFLTALAIVDDLGAVLIIALFYTSEIVWASLAVAAVFFILLLVVNKMGVRNPLVYSLLGIGLWVAFLKSGVHATIAGVLLALTIPPHSKIEGNEFLAHSRKLLNQFEKHSSTREKNLNETQRVVIQSLEEACEHAEAPLQRLEHNLHPWVSFFIMPVFALANAGVRMEGNIGGMLSDPVTLGIIFGLVIGKQLGITSFIWLAVKSRLAVLPRGITWLQIYGVGWLAGIGFTMSLFIAGLAFTSETAVIPAKFGILLASLICGCAGWLILRYSKTENKERAVDSNAA